MADQFKDIGDLHVQLRNGRRAAKRGEGFEGAPRKKVKKERVSIQNSASSEDSEIGKDSVNAEVPQRTVVHDEDAQNFAASESGSAGACGDEDEYRTWKEVPWDVGAEDPGIFVEYATKEAAHACLANAAVLPPGLAQGATQVNSLNNLKNWFRIQCNTVVPGCQVPLVTGSVSDVAFHHITFVQFMAILQRINVIPWSHFCLNNQLSAGRICTVTNAGLGSNEATNAPFGPFL